MCSTRGEWPPKLVARRGVLFAEKLARKYRLREVTFEGDCQGVMSYLTKMTTYYIHSDIYSILDDVLFFSSSLIMLVGLMLKEMEMMLSISLLG